MKMNISNGRTDIKAYILNKEIFINLDKADIASPIHEMMHLILGTIKTTNRNIYLSLINNAKNHPNFNQVLKKYSNNTKLDIYEEIFIDLFTNTIKGKIQNNFKLNEIDNVIKNTLNEMLKLGSNLDSISGIEILNTSFEDIINTFGSDLFINQSEYYNPVIATKSIKLSSNDVLIEKAADQLKKAIIELKKEENLNLLRDLSDSDLSDEERKQIKKTINGRW